MTESKLEFTPTYARIPMYLNLVEEALAAGKDFISGTEIAVLMGTSSIQVRKDLSFAGLKGIPKRGYSTKSAVTGLREFLTWNTKKKTFLIGVGNLAKAIILHKEFKECGLYITNIFDNDPKKIGQKIGDFTIESTDSLVTKLKRSKPEVAILTLTYNDEVQKIAKLLVQHGVKGIWNFTKKKLLLKENVAVYNTDFLSSFAVLCADMKRRNN
ncbi:MAG: redox-sensing transcriptional repressor Rex [Spirochaetaceae bacterium]|nr:redox-sensing transcriptional repressor Rex [Spirochaetaceae bacterium]